MVRTLISLLASLSFAVATLGQSPPPPPYDALLQKAQATGTDALYVTVDGKPTVDWARGERKPIELMSAVKSLVAIAVGRMLQDGKLKSLDEPVHTFYPEWNQGRKKSVTVRHLLNHTSGLQNNPNAGAEIYPAPNAIQLALAAELTSEPGLEFSYNNKAVNLLAGIIERATGSRMDLYFGEKIFAPLGITDYQWYFDKSGQPHAMAGLRLRAEDAAKFGQLVLDGGNYGSTRILPETYVTEMLAAGQAKHPLCGLLWWRYAPHQSIALRQALPAMNDPTLSAQLETLLEERYKTRREMRAALERKLGAEYEQKLVTALGADWFSQLFDWQTGPVVAYYAEGYLGQYIVVIPERKVVAVRQIAQRAGLTEETTFANFTAELVAAVEAGAH